MKTMAEWPEGYGRRVLDEVDSTLSEAARIAPFLPGPEWILSLRQTAGRGRRGRAWADPEGNFAATLVLRPDEPPALAAQRSFVTALAVHDACQDVTGRSEGLALKWPNDILLNGGKLSGILLESVSQSARLDYLAIGIGVNLRSAPGADAVEPGAVRPVSLLSETGKLVDPETFLTYLAAAYARYEAQFTQFGFAPIRTAWMDRAARRGKVITARTGNSETTGTFETLDDSGNLVLTTTRGRVNIPAADIFF